MRSLLRPAAAALVLTAAGIAGAAGAGASPRVMGEVPPAVPATGTYLGVDPHFDPAATPDQQLVAFQDTVGRKMAIVSLYMSFGGKVPLKTMEDVAAQGSLPMLSWHCSGLDSAVASGADDATIRAEATALAGYGHPVLLRWFWEMNLSTVAAYAACLGPAGSAAAEYVAAFRHIVTIFREVGASNVAFVWAPSAAYYAPSAVAFYPGSAYVDWIGFDLYNRPDRPQGFSATFARAYDVYASYGKPMALTETGAPAGSAGPGGGSPTQAQWLQQIASSLPTSFPEVHAVVYVDASDLADYVLSGAGLTAFETMGETTYFSAAS
jgi:hypothetical protein